MWAWEGSVLLLGVSFPTTRMSGVPPVLKGSQVVQCCAVALAPRDANPKVHDIRVSWISRRRKWLVAFRCGGRYYFVGNFDDEGEAAKAYDEAILPLAGEFARLNFQRAA